MAIRMTPGLDAIPSTPFATTRARLADTASIITHGGLAHGSTKGSVPAATSPHDIVAAVDLYASQLQAGHPRSLAGIAMRAFVLGAGAASATCLTLALLYFGQPTWRAPFFVSTLCLFHFLEFWATAQANAPAARVSSFLLTSNGAAYTIAHSCALLETAVTNAFFPSSSLPPAVLYSRTALGLLLIMVGQVIRALAMLTAGPSFSHYVADHKQSTHVLVKHGVYRILRHPSYFGFFWWGIGTQLVCGNSICLVGYAMALYCFFKARILGEEVLLLKFFGQEYLEYRDRTVVGIPGLG